MSKEAKQTVEEAAKAFANKKWPDLKNERQAHVREYAKNDFKAGAEWAAPLPNERTAKQHKEGKTELPNDIKEAIKSIIITAYDDGRKYGINNSYGIKGGSSYFDKYGNRLLERLPFTPPTGN